MAFRPRGRENTFVWGSWLQRGSGSGQLTAWLATSQTCQFAKSTQGGTERWGGTRGVSLARVFPHAHTQAGNEVLFTHQITQ